MTTGRIGWGLGVVAACAISAALTGLLVSGSLSGRTRESERAQPLGSARLEELNARVRALEARPRLKEKVTLVREEDPHADGATPNDEPVADTRAQPSLSPEERQWAADEWGRQLTEFVRSQPSHEEWSQSLMAELNEAVNAEEFAGARVLESECNGSLCRARIQMNCGDAAEAEDARDQLMVTKPFKRTSLVLTKEDGTLEVFLAKTGSAIPKREGVMADE